MGVDQGNHQKERLTLGGVGVDPLQRALHAVLHRTFTGHVALVVVGPCSGAAAKLHKAAAIPGVGGVPPLEPVLGEVAGGKGAVGVCSLVKMSLSLVDNVVPGRFHRGRQVGDVAGQGRLHLRVPGVRHGVAEHVPDAVLRRHVAGQQGRAGGAAQVGVCEVVFERQAVLPEAGEPRHVGRLPARGEVLGRSLLVCDEHHYILALQIDQKVV